MKDWPDNHPKAKAMARRQAEILEAAKLCFLHSGYAGTSMDAIADKAGISLMTLYRHAENKDDLFATTVSNACSARDEQEREYFEGLVTLPFRELLVTCAIHMQAKVARPDTIALMRLVIAEAPAFPHLLALAFDGFVAHFERLAVRIILAKSNPDRHTLEAAARALVDCVVGADVLRVLLGQHTPADADRRRKAEVAADQVLTILAAGTTPHHP